MKIRFLLFASAAFGLWACAKIEPSDSSTDPSSERNADDARDPASADAAPPPDCTADVQQLAPCTADQARCAQPTCAVCGPYFTKAAFVFTCEPNPAQGNALQWTTSDAVDCAPFTKRCGSFFSLFSDAQCTNVVVCA